MKTLLQDQDRTDLQTAGPGRGRLSRFLDDRQGKGQLVLSIDEVAQVTGLSPLAARRQAARLAPRLTRLPGRPTTFLVVPPEDRARGAPPIAAWLDAYLRLRGQPYYVGLLSAAAFHGSAMQAPQVTQVLTTNPMRAVSVGRLHIEYFVKRGAERTPLTGLHGLPAPLAVSSPEATALDLVSFSHRIGGIERVIEVIAGLQPAMSVAGLTRAVRVGVPITVLQRIGYVFDALGWESFASVIQHALPPRFPATMLQTHGPRVRAEPHERWLVVDNLGLRESRS